MSDEWNEEMDDNIYTDEARENQVDEGGITPEEAAFMKGYDDADKFDSMAFYDEDEESESDE